MKKNDRNPYTGVIIGCAVLFVAALIVMECTRNSDKTDLRVLVTMTAWGLLALIVRFGINAYIYRRLHRAYPDKVYDEKSFLAYCRSREEEDKPDAEKGLDETSRKEGRS